MNLTEFLLARIAEDEELADMVARDSIGYTVDGDFPSESWGISGTSRGNPAMIMDVSRVLAECEANRQVVEAYQGAEIAYAAIRVRDEAENGPDYRSPLSDTLSGAASAFKVAVQILAAVYANHPDFDPSWAVKARAKR